MSEHSKTPWELFDLNGVLSIKNPRARSSKSEIVFWTGFDASHYPKQSRANAAFIVRAVNAHDDLVKALRWARHDLEAARTLARHTLGEPAGLNQTIEKVDAALAKAAENAP